MLRHQRIPIALAIGAALSIVEPVEAQYYPAGGWYRPVAPPGYMVPGWGYHNGTIAPTPGGFQTYYSGRPMVITVDPWGRAVEVPLRPKVLYYSDQILTPHGSIYPTRIVVIPDDRAAPKVPTRTRTATSRPAAGTVPDQRIPRAADLESPKELVVPDPGKLPEVPTIPGTSEPKTDRLPKLGPAPGNSSPDKPDR